MSSIHSMFFDFDISLIYLLMVLHIKDSGMDLHSVFHQKKIAAYMERSRVYKQSQIRDIID